MRVVVVSCMSVKPARFACIGKAGTRPRAALAAKNPCRIARHRELIFSYVRAPAGLSRARAGGTLIRRSLRSSLSP